MKRELTAGPLVLHSYVLLVLAGVLMKLALVAVVLSITAAYCLLGFAITAEGAHAFGWQAVWRLDTGASIAAGHLGAGILQSCRREEDMKTRFSQKQRGSYGEEYTCQPAALQDTYCYCTLESIMDDRPPYLSGYWCTFGSSAQLFWVWRTTWHSWVKTHCHSCLLVQTSCVSFHAAAWIDSAARILYCYAQACFSRHGWKATLWIFTFPKMRLRRRRGNRYTPLEDFVST